jgi:hypothetical protein
MNETAQVIVFHGEPATADRALKIAAFLGADVRVAAAASQVSQCTCLLTDAESLAQAVDGMPSPDSTLRHLFGLAEHVCIFGWQPTERHAAILRVISSGGLTGIQPQSEMQGAFHMAADHRRWTGQLAGLRVRAAAGSGESVFIEGKPESEQSVIIRLGAAPFFVRSKYAEAHVYFLAASELADLDQRVGGEANTLNWFSRVVPVLMFLRGVLGDRVWHNDRPQACFIIDDPLLRRRYGHFGYEQMMEAMRHQAFTACIAFIPWNYRRSRKAVARLLNSRSMFSLCVHGCDHTGGEFGSRDVELLRGKSQMALDRMHAHSRVYGVPFDDVMVFPQGCFSAEALNALNGAGYLAAINSSVHPSTTTEDLQLRDLLSVAVTRFSNFPLFGRHYPKDLAEFALDLFLGKQVLLVEHHGYFRNGYGELQDFIRRLNALDERLEWTSPGTLCSRACVMKMAGEHGIDVQFYTRRFCLRNEERQVRRYTVRRRQDGEDPTLSVIVNGSLVHHRLQGDNLEFEVWLQPGQTAEIELRSEQRTSARVPYKPTRSFQSKVLLRRLLSEFRDNYVDTNLVLRRLVTFIRKQLAGRKATGGVARRPSQDSAALSGS